MFSIPKQKYFNFFRPVWADDDWLSTFAGKQSLEQQAKDEEHQRPEVTSEQAEAPKAKRPAETEAQEGQVDNQIIFEILLLNLHLVDILVPMLKV